MSATGQRNTSADPLQAALDEAADVFSARNPKSGEMHRKAARFLPGGNTRSVLYYDPFPLTFMRGEGCRVEDADGHEYIDFLGEYTAGIYGHSNPDIRDAVEKALQRGINLGGHGPLEAGLAELVCGRFPSVELVRFTNSGTEANLLALSLAKAFTGRQTIIVFEGGYHGGLMTFAGGGSPVNVPHRFVVAPYNEVEATRALVREHRDDLAAVLVEPMIGSGGCIPGDPEFLAMLREETAAGGALLIFDEVMTSRLAPGGRQEMLGILPDLTTMGKYIGGGMSFGAFGGRQDIMRLFDPSRPGSMPHAGTFNNNVLTMAAGTVGLGSIYTPEAASELSARGDRLREALNALFAREDLPLVASGLGSLMNLHPLRAAPTRVADLASCDRRIRDLVFFDLLEDGIYIARRGFITLMLPTGEAETERLLSVVGARAPRWRELFGER